LGEAKGLSFTTAFGFYLSAFLFVVIVFSLLLHLVCYKYTTKPIVAFLLVLASVVTSFIHQYGVVIDRTMIQNVLETDWQETYDLINTPLLMSLMVLGVIPAVIVIRVPLQFKPWRRELIQKLSSFALSFIILTIILVSFGAEIASLFRNHRELRFVLTPTNAIQSSISYLKHRSSMDEKPVIIPNAVKDKKWESRTKPVVTIIVIGETARAKDFSLNGHERITNPLLQKESIVYFPKVTSCGTSTAISLPCMFSDLGREKYEQKLAKQRGNLLDILARADFDVLWRDNNSGCKGICDRIESEDLAQNSNEEFCRNGECFDEILTYKLDDRIKNTTRSQVIVLHQKGSHGPAYFRRYPSSFEIFTPTCQSADLARCTKEEIHNAYDNTILYTDFVLSRIITILKANSKKVDSALLYVSDHGESLGEFGMYLHGAPRAIAPAVQYEIPMLAWFSDGFSQNMAVDINCVRSKADRPYSHDHFFHSITGLLEVRTPAYQSQLDIFSQCRR
jgi:lipid A ethanolaminephosphotransferase